MYYRPVKLNFWMCFVCYVDVDVPLRKSLWEPLADDDFLWIQPTLMLQGRRVWKGILIRSQSLPSLQF